VAALALPAVALAFAGCAGSSVTNKGSAAHRSPPPLPRPSGPAFGLTEDNADLLWNPADHAAPAGGAFQAARDRLTALHPRYLRLLVDWAALQPRADSPPSLYGPVDGCARSVAPCGAYAGLGEELAAIASQQRAARAQGRPGFEVVLDVFGAPAWAAEPASGCELKGTRAFARPISAAGLVGYRALIGSLLALGAREGVALTWWSPWNEPNDPVFLSPQRAACTADSPSLAPAVYAQLAQVMAAQLTADGGVHHLLLGELNAFASDSPHRTSVQAFVAALPDTVLCLGHEWSIHAYAARHGHSPALDPVELLQHALQARAGCAANARIWVTEAGAGARHPGRPRPPGEADEREGCSELAEQVKRWSENPRVDAVLQYTFREDPAFPVGLLSADLSHTLPAYRFWLLYTRASAQGKPAPPGAAACT